MTDRKCGFDHIAELLQDNERAFHTLGPVWGSPPSLFEAKLPPGRAVYASVLALLDHIEADDECADQLRDILASCVTESDRRMTASAALFGLQQEPLEHVLRVFAWTAQAGGIGPDDFEDGGQRFLRLTARQATKADIDEGATA
tara:strand:+ start:33249 stop:33680 length:432 start_codon:yes stop_codon:yes gene_type:complete